VAFYTPANPPVTWPPTLPTGILGQIALPAVFTYRNLGTVNDKGIELGVEGVVNRYVNAIVNYSYQADPDVDGFDPSETNFPANNRFNAGVNFNYDRYVGNFMVSYTGEAYWQDVLDQRFAGTTDAFTLLNLGFGVKWLQDRLVTTLKINNLANSEVQQHVFGDIIKRQIVGEIRYAF
jgi:hypothetical protein